MGNQTRASCSATFMQNKSNCDVERFTTYESNLSCNKSGSQVACVQTPPAPQKEEEEWRLWIAVVNRVPVYICINFVFCFFLFSLWQLKRCWKTNTTLESCTTRTQLLFFLRGSVVCTQVTRRLLLQRIARMDIDWNLKKLGQLFQVLMLCLQTSPKKAIGLVLSDDICYIF